MSSTDTDKQASTEIGRVEKAVYKRGPRSFQVKVRVGAHWITQTFDTQEDAHDFYELKRIARARDADFERVVSGRVKSRRAAKLTFDDMLKKYLTECTAKKKHCRVEENRIARIRASRIAAKSFIMVEADDIKTMFRDFGLSSTQQLKFVAIIRHLFNVAREEWEVPVNNPCLKMVLPKANPPRERRISKEEYRWLLDQLGQPIRRNRELIKLVRLAMGTACRQGELANLEWQSVNLSDSTLTVIASHSKTGKTRTVPLIPEAVAVLRELGGATVPTRGRVFRSTQEALRQAWHRAVRRARVMYCRTQEKNRVEPDPGFLHDLHFHDIRHEAISWICETFDMKDLEIAEIVGHSSLTMTKRYTHLRAKHLAQKMADQLRNRADAGPTGAPD